MSNSPNGGNPNGAPSPENTRPAKECPICDEKTKLLPDHILHEHN